MSESTNKIVDRIRKLLKLAQSANANEAGVAAAQAQRLMDEHRIESAAIGDPDGERPTLDSEPIDGVWTARSIHVWRSSLVAILARQNGVVTLRRGGAIEAVGRASDVTVLRYMFAFCFREIQRLAARDTKGRGADVANNYRIGCVLAIRDALVADRDQATAGGSTALVLVNARLDEANAVANGLINAPAKAHRFEKKARPGLRDGYLVASREIDLRKGLSDGAVPESRRLASGAA